LNPMKHLHILFSVVLISISFASCMTGNYVSKTSGTQTVTQAPMKLRLCHKARWTYYGYSTSAVFMYYEDAKFQKKGDTLYFRSRIEHGDTTKQEKIYEAKFVKQGDSLISLDNFPSYVRLGKGK